MAAHMTVTDLSADVTKPALLPIGQTFGGAALFPPRKNNLGGPRGDTHAFRNLCAFLLYHFAAVHVNGRKGKHSC